jgi:chemotaxis protein CheD
MMDEAIQIPGHYLYPSNLFASTDRHIITTILGSCVGICLYNKRLNFGGMNHYMLALWNGNGLASPRFGNIANEKLLNEMVFLGSARMHLIAKVFGGANQTTSYNDVGARNVQAAFEFLDQMDIPILAQNVGGEIGRKIMFDTFTGEVRMKFVQKTTTLTV